MQIYRTSKSPSEPCRIPILSSRSSLTKQKRPRLAVPPAGRILYSLRWGILFLCWLLRGDQKIPGLTQKETTKQKIRKNSLRIDVSPFSGGCLANHACLCPDKFLSFFFEVATFFYFLYSLFTFQMLSTFPVPPVPICPISPLLSTHSPITPLTFLCPSTPL